MSWLPVVSGFLANLTAIALNCYLIEPQPSGPLNYYCSDYGSYLNGITRDAQSPLLVDGIYFLRHGRCCPIPDVWRNKSLVAFNINWRESFGGPNSWSSCPIGYFMQGLRAVQGGIYLSDIREGRCIKPADYPEEYGQCEEVDTQGCFSTKGNSMCSCKTPDSFIVALYRGGCNELHCLNKIKCCTFTTKTQAIEDIAAVQKHIMEATLSKIARLASMMGFATCAGCSEPNIGEGFLREGTTWKTNLDGMCPNNKKVEEFTIEYSDWAFTRKEITYGDVIIEQLTPETLDTGLSVNNLDTERTDTISRTVESTRTVEHTVEDTFTEGHNLGISIGYQPGSEEGGMAASVTYSFSYTHEKKTVHNENKEDKHTFSLNTPGNIPPHSQARWKVLIHRTRQTVPYTAVVSTRFSVTLRGLLRPGNHPHPNFHNAFRGLTPTGPISYTFGDANNTFCNALKKESAKNERPWRWMDLLEFYKGKRVMDDARTLIEDLCKEDSYEFQLRGKFTDISGTNSFILWEKAEPASGKTASQGNVGKKIIKYVAKGVASDPPVPTSQPPVVNKTKGKGHMLDMIPADDYLLQGIY